MAAPHAPRGWQGNRWQGNRRGLVILLVLAGVSLMLLCACGGAAFVFLANTDGSGSTSSAPTRPRETPLEATAAFLTDVQAGNLASAYEWTCADVKDRFPRDRFDRVVAESGKLTSYVIGGVVRPHDGTARVEVTLHYADRPARQDMVDLLIGDDNDWLVCGDPF